MSVTSTHLKNFQLRVCLLFMGLILGALLGGWLGDRYVRQDMSPPVAAGFRDFIPARAMEWLGLNRIAHPQGNDRQTRFLYALRSQQDGYWSIYFETKARLAYVRFPLGGGIAGMVLVMLIGRRIGNPN